MKIQRPLYLEKAEYKRLVLAAEKERMSFNQFMIKAGFEKIERDKDYKKEGKK